MALDDIHVVTYSSRLVLVFEQHFSLIKLHLLTHVLSIITEVDGGSNRQVALRLRFDMDILIVHLYDDCCNTLDKPFVIL